LDVGLYLKKVNISIKNQIIKNKKRINKMVYSWVPTEKWTSQMAILVKRE
jgi:hypothetical protein